MARTNGSHAGARARGRRALAPVVLAVLVAGAVLAPVATGALGGDDRATADTRVDVDTDPAGAHVELGHDLSWVEVGGTPAGGAGGSGGHSSGCRRRWVPAAEPVAYLEAPAPVFAAPVPLPPAPSPDAKPYNVYCDGAYVWTVWATPSQFNGGDMTAAARSLAESLVQDLPFPAVGIGISPQDRGLAGLESWFWITGYDGATIVDSVSGFGTTVTVEARPTGVQWSFGDGTDTVPGDFGRAYPARSTVTHTYERRSGSDGFVVEADLALDARYRVNDGPWQPLDAVARGATATYRVDEARSQLQTTP
ncbi:MAG TPA: hypothetical protein VFC33_20190 [Acidimicrobiia bacterium]|nr:hypothetical protein [Acidimicrobiia bacterium]